MVNYRRALVPGGTFFFTVTIADRHSSILIENIRSLRQAFRTTRQERPFTIEAVVILPDHLHAIMTLPQDDPDFSGRWRRIKSLFTRHIIAGGSRIERDQRGEYSLWQRRFWEHAIRDERDFVGHVDYIHYNPVKHGLVSQASNWPYSSFHRYLRKGWLPADWGVTTEIASRDFGERRG
jgi:putative transposase